MLYYSQSMHFYGEANGSREDIAKNKKLLFLLRYRKRRIQRGEKRRVYLEFQGLEDPPFYDGGGLRRFMPGFIFQRSDGDEQIVVSYRLPLLRACLIRLHRIEKRFADRAAYDLSFDVAAVPFRGTRQPEQSEL